MVVRSILRNLIGGARHVDIGEWINEFHFARASKEKLIL